MGDDLFVWLSVRVFFMCERVAFFFSLVYFIGPPRLMFL